MLDLIKSISTILVSITGTITCIVSIITLHRNRIAREQSSMAQIEIFPIKIVGDPIPKIRVQNFGKSSGKIVSVTLGHELPTNKMVVNPFEYYNNMTLASGQSFTTVFVINDNALETIPVEEFNVTIKVKTLGKEYEKTCHVNYKFLDGCIETKQTPTDVTKALNNINQSIRGLQ